MLVKRPVGCGIWQEWSVAGTITVGIEIDSTLYLLKARFSETNLLPVFNVHFISSEK